MKSRSFNVLIILDCWKNKLRRGYRTNFFSLFCLAILLVTSTQPSAAIAMGDNDAVQLASSSDSAYTAEMSHLYQAVSLNAILSIDGTSESHTSDSTADTSANPRPLAVGEVITYRMVIEIPEGTSLPDVQVTDTLAPNIEFITGSTRISYSANNTMNISVPGILNELNPTTSLPAGLISFGLFGPRELRFDINQVVNNDTDNTASAELLIIEFQAVVVNTGDNTSGAISSNDFEVDVDNDGTDEDVSNEVFFVVHEPVLSVDKSINTTLSNPAGTTMFDGGDTVIYDILVTGGNAANQTTAFDLQVIDNINSNLDLVDIDFIGTPAYATTTDNSDYAMPIQTVDATISQLRPGDTVTIRVTVTVSLFVLQGQVANTANLTWTSLPGLKGTGNATPGNSGDTDGERNGNATGENDHRATDNANFTVSLPRKFIDATSETATSDKEDGSTGNERPVAIGEQVTYRLVVPLPESTSIFFTIRDVLPTGVEFIPGSAKVSYLASTLPSLNGDFSGIQNESNPTFSFPASRINFNSGTRTLAFDFGSIINNDGDFNSEYLIIEFDTVVTDIGSNTTGTIRANDFDLVIDELLPTETITASDSVGIRIVEPDIALTKTFTPDMQVPSDNVSMTLVVDNLAANGATAAIFDLTLTDTLDDWLNVTSVAVNLNASATTFGSTFTDNSTLTPGFATGVSDTVSIAISSLPIDGVATVTITMQVDPNADPLSLPRNITNNASITGDSLASDISPDDEDRAYSANATDDLSILDGVFVTATSLQATYTNTGPSTFTVTFSEDVNNPTGNSDPDDVTNPDNFLLVEKGINGIADTVSCVGSVQTDDVQIAVSGITYINPTAIVTLAAPLPVGSYRLFVCGTTSIVDFTLTPLNGGLSDFTFDFVVTTSVPVTTPAESTNTTASSLPTTGFTPNKVSTLPDQPATLKYAKLGDLWLEIPSLNVKSNIVGVPQVNGDWDVTWLGNDTGWLNGTAFPTWTGNSVLTAHVTNASGLQGPFAALKQLKYGDQIIVHMGGMKYVYEVRETKLSRPYSTSYAFESKQDAAYLTLITCSGYNPLNESYLFRRVVRAVLVSTVSE